jgi:hypothetical protein
LSGRFLFDQKQLSSRSPVREGRPFPLGATWDGLGINFALFSANAAKVELCRFNLDGRRELERIALPEVTDEVWHSSPPEREDSPWFPVGRERPVSGGSLLLLALRGRPPVGEIRPPATAHEPAGEPALTA